MKKGLVLAKKGNEKEMLLVIMGNEKGNGISNNGK